MPGSGKTELGRRAAKLLGAQFVDTDMAIEIIAGTSIAEIFASQGEAAFRRMETETITDLHGAYDTPCLVATGGGVVTVPENLPLLQMLGTVVYIRRDFDAIASGVTYGADRPLLTDPSALETLWASRKELYESWADRTFAVIEGEAIGDAAARLAKTIAEGNVS
jgi:shikimate kinase